jgi:drug/metabolite transporter (DMT)-like permease
MVVLFIGLSSGVGYVLWLWALKHTTPTRVTVFLSLSPVTAALLGVWILDEPFTPGVLVGLVGVIGGLWLATKAPAVEAR